MENVNANNNNGQNNGNFNNFRRYNSGQQNFDTVNVKTVETPELKDVTVKTDGVKKFITPTTAACVGGALVLVVGYLGYRHFFKNKKKSNDTPKEESKAFEEVK